MADHYTLEAQPRALVGKKVSQLRAQSIVPVVVYGPGMGGDTEPLALQVPYRPLELVLMKAGRTGLIDMLVESRTITVLAREVQRNVLRGSILHVDFFAPDLNVTTTAEIRIHLEGESPVVETGAGMLSTGINTITIEALPSKLVDVARVDISVLKNIGDAIHVRDLDLGPDIAILNDTDDLIVRVAPSAAIRAEEEEEETGGAAEPEVIHRGKADEDEG